MLFPLNSLSILNSRPLQIPFSFQGYYLPHFHPFSLLFDKSVLPFHTCITTRPNFHLQEGSGSTWELPKTSQYLCTHLAPLPASLQKHQELLLGHPLAGMQLGWYRQRDAHPTGGGKRTPSLQTIALTCL